MIELISAVCIWGLSFALAKKALNQFTPFELVAIRLTLGALSSAFFAKIASRGLKNTSHELRRQTFILGALEFAGTYILYTWALVYLPSGVVGSLTLLTPVLTYYLACAFKVELPSLKAWAAVGLSVVGAFLCFPVLKIFGGVGLSKEELFGFCLVLLSNFSFAAGNVFITRLKDQGTWKGVPTSGALSWGALLAFVVAILTARSPMLGGGMSSVFAGGFGPWILPLYLGLIPTGLGFFLWNRGVTKTSAFPASLIGNFKGPMSVFWGVVLLHESFDVKFFFGVVLLFCSTQMISMPRSLNEA